MSIFWCNLDGGGEKKLHSSQHNKLAGNHRVHATKRKLEGPKKNDDAPVLVGNNVQDMGRKEW